MICDVFSLVVLSVYAIVGIAVTAVILRFVKGCR